MFEYQSGIKLNVCVSVLLIFLRILFAETLSFTKCLPATRTRSRLLMLFLRLCADPTLHFLTVVNLFPSFGWTWIILWISSTSCRPSAESITDGRLCRGCVGDVEDTSCSWFSLSFSSSLCARSVIFWTKSLWSPWKHSFFLLMFSVMYFLSNMKFFKAAIRSKNSKHSMVCFTTFLQHG